MFQRYKHFLKYIAISLVLINLLKSEIEKKEGLFKELKMD
jgi:hypothetical protein